MKSIRTFSVNRKARFNYEIVETFEAGLALLGTEIKAIREGRATIGESYARPEGGEMWLLNAHISEYSAGGISNHEPTRKRKLLLHKQQISYLAAQVSEKGLTLVPLKLYLKGHNVKVQIGVARGRKRYDKRRAIIDKEREREAGEAIKRMR
jgi:SsrA-binding protein